MHLASLSLAPANRKYYKILVINVPIIYPKHPRVGLLKSGSRYGNIEIREPMGYIEFHGIMKKAWVVLTDSGGIQEETTAMSVPCVTLRTTTERPVTIEKGTNVLCRNIDDLGKCLEKALTKRGRTYKLWDGRAGERIVEFIKKDLGKK